MFIRVGIRKTRSKHWRLSWFRYETFITFFKFWFFDTRRETHNFSMLTVRPSSALNSLTQPMRTRSPQSITGLASPRSRNQLGSSKSKSQLTAFSKSLRIPAHCFRAWCHSHPQSHFLSGVFIVTSVIVSPCVNVCTYPCTNCPVSWGCRIQRLLLCRGVRLPQRVSWIWH